MEILGGHSRIEAISFYKADKQNLFYLLIKHSKDPLKTEFYYCMYNEFDVFIDLLIKYKKFNFILNKYCAISIIIILLLLRRNSVIFI